MAKKRKNQDKPRRELTRRQLSMWERQRRRQRLIFYSGISVIAAIVVIVATGFYMTQYRPLHETVLTVNDTQFNMQYYVNALEVSARGQPAEYVPSLASYVAAQIEQMEMVRQGALELNISVSDAEAKQQLAEVGLPVNDATLDIARYQLLIGKLKDEYFGPQAPQTANQAHVLAMLLESESQAAEVRQQLLDGGDFAALAAELSLNDLTKTGKGDLDWHPQDVLNAMIGTSVVGDYAFGSEAGTLSQPRYDEDISKNAGYWLVEVLERQEDSGDAQVQAILLGSEEEANDVKTRLDAGEDFASLAGELSQDATSKAGQGSLGTVTEGQLSPALDEYVFSSDTPVGTLSAPIRDDTVQTTGGYWLIKVEEREADRELSADDHDYVTGKALEDWATTLWASGQVDDSLLTSEKMAWAADQVTKDLQ